MHSDNDKKFKKKKIFSTIVYTEFIYFEKMFPVFIFN